MVRLIVLGDGDTDFLFMKKAMAEDQDLSQLAVKIVRPEDVGLKRRAGGGHLTLLKDAGMAAIKAARGVAEGVLVLVDNDGDPRFAFPHAHYCGDCRECEAMDALNRVSWGEKFEKKAIILYQAVETLLLSARPGFTPQIEGDLRGKKLKVLLYGYDIREGDQLYRAFRRELEATAISRMRARSWPRLKLAVMEMEGKIEKGENNER